MKFRDATSAGHHTFWPFLLLVVLLSGCAGGNGGGPRVVDSQAKLSYNLPSGWEEKPREDLLEFFTSVSGIETDDRSNGGLLAVGPMEGLFEEDASDLATSAQTLAISFAEFFVPFSGERDVTTDEAVEVSGFDAHRVKLEITPDTEPPATVEAVVVEREGGASYILGIVSPADSRLERQVEEALDSLEVID